MTRLIRIVLNILQVVPKQETADNSLKRVLLKQLSRNTRLKTQLINRPDCLSDDIRLNPTLTTHLHIKYTDQIRQSDLVILNF